MKVMIVDDNERIRRVIKTVVEQQPAVVCECRDGAEALANYNNFSPDWVFMDIRMNGFDGITTTQQLLIEHPAARVVIVSQFDDEAYRISAIYAGAVGFVSKERLFEINDILGEDVTNGQVRFYNPLPFP